MSFLPALSFTASASSRALCAPTLSAAASTAVASAAVDTTYTLFERVNVLSFLKYLGSDSGAPRDSFFWATVGKGLLSGLDELAFVLLYLVSAEALLKAAWRATHWQWTPSRSRGETTAKSPAAEESSEQLPCEVASAPVEFDEGSLAAALLHPAQLLGWVMLGLWMVDAAYLVLVTLGVASGKGAVPRILSYVAYTYAAGTALGAWKNHLINRVLTARTQAMLEDLDSSAKAQAPASAAETAKRIALGAWRKARSAEQVTETNKFLLRRGSSIVLWAALGLVCMDAVSLNVGVALGSALSFAGVGGLAVGLATKDLVSNLVGGCLVFVTQPFVEGDLISFDKLTAAKVTHIGWYQTTVVSNDEQVSTVPNAKFVSSTISNLSRRSHLAVRETVSLTFAALPRLEPLVDALRAALADVPGVDRTSRNFVVCAKRIGDVGVELEVELHFKGTSGPAFRKRRQAALVAMAKVVEEHGAEFAVRER